MSNLTTFVKPAQRRRLSVGTAIAGAALSTVVSLVLAAPALASPIALIAGPVRAGGPNGYRMLVMAGQGSPFAKLSGSAPGSGGSHSNSKDSLVILFSRAANANSGREVIEQIYSFPLRSSVMTVFAQTGRLITGLGRYGAINMSFGHGKLTGTFGFTDVPFRGRSPLPARVFHGTVLQAFTHQVKPPKPPTPVCPPFGFAELTGFSSDAAGSLYFVTGLRPGLGRKATIIAAEFPSASVTAPATEIRELVLTGAPSTDLSVQQPSQSGNQTNTGGATLLSTGGLPRLQGALGFDTEFSTQAGKGSCPYTVESGSLLDGPAANQGAVSQFRATFDGPVALKSVMTFPTPAMGDLLTR